MIVAVYLAQVPRVILWGTTQSIDDASSTEWLTSTGVIGTIVLVSLVMLVSLFILSRRISAYVDRHRATRDARSGVSEDSFVHGTDSEDQRPSDEIGTVGQVVASGGALISNVRQEPDNPFFSEKKKAELGLQTPGELKKLVIWYLGAATFWLFFGTTIGEYLGFKFFWPEMDSISWLGFGRLRPVHTNTVFWGWASLAMLGLAYFVIPRTSNTSIFSYKMGWQSFGLINVAVLLGNVLLMAGINNGGGEYREYIWPVMLLFMIALVITFVNFYKTIASRKITDIYISNWFILGALAWTIILSVIGYLPLYQDGLGETVIQGYYMHQGVGMWFMTFTLGLIYYYLPASLNKPIYSYSLGVLAFWTQMLFYTMIGSHHFVFSPLPWWLQTVAIVSSIGMFIPVIAGTTNFLMTMRGSWTKISTSYVLPFFLVGTVFYFVGSGQGSFQATRFTNYLWHFTDFNIAHSHMTMYGIITFFMWACIYAILPRLTGREPMQILVGAHFWMALVGLLAYMISLMSGGTAKGLAWIGGQPFLESVTLMAPYWVWRAVGGSMMYLAHLIFAFNFYVMVRSAPRPAPHGLEQVRLVAPTGDLG